MASLNKVLLIGNLTRDPDVRMMSNGRPVCNFGLALNRSYKDGEGNRKEETTFVEVESFVLSNGKRLVLVLNKADLIPKENLESWTKYLRGELPAIAFKSSTQNQATKLGHSKIDIAKSTENQLQTSKCVGASTLMAMLGNYCRNKDIKTSIRVGVVGLPNVGKSSLINSLKRSKVSRGNKRKI
mgnify:CR=1 FL=1